MKRQTATVNTKASVPTDTRMSKRQSLLQSGSKRDLTLLSVLTAAEAKAMYPAIPKSTFYAKVRTMRRRQIAQGRVILLMLADVVEVFGDPVVLQQEAVIQPSGNGAKK